MKRVAELGIKASRLTAILVAILAGGIYSISCVNAGGILSWTEFSNGLLGRYSNCGGNSAAKTICDCVSLSAFVHALDSGGTLDLSQLSEEQKKEMAHALSTSHWTGDAKYLFRKGPVTFGEKTHEVVVVCDTAFGNVPQPSFWNLHRRTFRHAAGFSDGSAGFITPKEFAALDKSKFFAPNLTTAETTNVRTNVFE